MTQLAIKGHPTRGKEIIEILEMLGGINKYNLRGDTDEWFILNGTQIQRSGRLFDGISFTLEQLKEKYPYKVGDRVSYRADKLLETQVITNMRWDSNYDCVLYYLDNFNIIKVEDILYKIGSPEDNIPTIQDKSTVETMKEDKGNISDGYHTFNELYEYRLLYNASMFNELAKQKLYDVHKSKRHSGGEECFGGGWFIVQAQLPTGQISNHYEMKDWDLFQIPEKEKANPYDGHTPQDVVKRLREFLTPKSQYPKTYKECCKILGIEDRENGYCGYEYELLGEFQKLYICRNAYWKIAGEQMGLGKPWKPDFTNNDEERYGIYTLANKVERDFCGVGDVNMILSFPTEEMRDKFYNNFKDLINEVKELL